MSLTRNRETGTDLHCVSERAQVVADNPYVSAATLARQWENPLVYPAGA